MLKCFTRPSFVAGMGLILVSFSAGAICADAGAEGPARATTEPRMMWNMEELGKSPGVHPAPGFDENEKDGIRALFYDGPAWKGKPTRVFAWYGAPKTAASDAGNAVGKKLPAMVLVHGGGGTAFAEWVKLWNSRGYAAIAMDTCGCVPRGKYGDWHRHDAGGPPGWGGFDRIDDDPRDQWTWQAVAGVILAHSLIRSFPEVDPEMTGITGISWGGYLTCIIAGADPRFKFAAPVYGCGYLGDNSAWLPNFKQMGEEKASRWLGLWDPSVYLPLAKMPMLWVTGTNDFAYPMDSLQKSYRLAPGPDSLCIRVRMPHGHGGAGENPPEIGVFAESVLRGGLPLTRATAQGRDGNRAWVKYEGRRTAASAEFNYTLDAGPWPDRKWETIPAKLDAASSSAEADVPDGTTVYYFNIIDADGLASSSEHVETKR
ncbi:MAG TPA: acetylxylan esterase [Candidatus Brocadiia bacterium]|nr:acetylxylan esterase [Candidatus Brocadiia bacterium]